MKPTTERRCARGLAGLAFAVAATFAPGAKIAVAAEPRTWHAETLTSSSQRGVQVTQYWAKGPGLLRAETVLAGQRLVTIVNGDLYYTVNETTGTVLAIKRSKRAMDDGKKRSRLMGLEAFLILERGGEKVKSEPLAGRMCDVYKQTDQRGRREVWVQQNDAKDMLPLRVEFYNRQAAATIRTDYIQWASGLELPDRLFQPDPRYAFEELDYDAYMAQAGELMIPVLHGALLHGEK